MSGNLDELARPSGGLAMVAMDQRESLRAMFAQVRADPIDDATLTEFKLAVARELGPLASGFLIDRLYGFDAVTAEPVLPDSCGLILAVDDLQHEGAVVVDTGLDRAVDVPDAIRRGAVALKLLVLWRNDGQQERRIAMAAEFIEMCREAGLCSVLEPVARPADGESDFDLNRGILHAAAHLGPLRPSLYKAQVPGQGLGPASEIATVCEQLTAALPVPWVVLSQGVAIADFPGAVEIACRAGASGFLAGRGVWSDSIGAGDPVGLLRTRAADRLRRLADIVDEHARPWTTVEENR
ncbi:MAG TPA: hypothetical protein VHC49_18600 [Mycobacteriales bacterium]|nr:hypothetical protein [Mycobacteriales bacterium]